MKLSDGNLRRRLQLESGRVPREQFISLMTSDLPEAPGYFSMDAEINRRGAGMLSEIAVAALTPAEANKAMQQGALVLDVRADEVGVKMSLEDVADPHAVRLGLVDVLLHVALGIDHGGFAVGADEIGGVGKAAEVELFKVHVAMVNRAPDHYIPM